MDPTTAFSLACGIIQVIDFGTKIVLACKQLREKGSISEYENLEKIAEHLTGVCSSLSNRAQHTGNVLLPADTCLFRLADECSIISNQLVKKVHGLRVANPRKKREVFKKTVRAFWESREIQEIQKKLERFRTALDTQILASLRLSEGATHLNQLGDLTRDEGQKTRNHIDHSLQQLKDQQKLEGYRDRFLDSLWFPEISSREENIADAHRKTFDWVFDGSDHALRPWDNLNQWLESGESTYWINGKAGSGKSTLMSFLCQDKRTSASLEKWSGKGHLIMPKFFFWSAGTAMQRFILGLLRSLIWQISQYISGDHLSQCLGDIHSGLRLHSLSSLSSSPSWTQRLLSNTLRAVIQQLSTSRSICFFIDGLDEFEGEQDDLIDCIKGIVGYTSVKICLSSRPYRAFSKGFGDNAKLQLQDLTREDIALFVEDNLRIILRISTPLIHQPDFWNDVKLEIIRKAEGVFLWVSLALQNLKRGASNGDSTEQLWQRLESLPSEIEGLYEHMLGQIEPLYWKEASTYLLRTLYEDEFPDLLDFTLLRFDNLDQVLGSSHMIPKQHLIALSHSTRSRLTVICAGLLEAIDERPDNRGALFTEDSAEDSTEDSTDYGDSTDSDKQSNTNSDDHGGDYDGEYGSSEDDSYEYGAEATEGELEELGYSSRVAFIHRTAYDFITTATQRGRFAEPDAPQDLDLKILIIKTFLAKMRLCGLKENVYYNLDMLMKLVLELEVVTATAQQDLYNMIDHTVASMDKLHQDRKHLGEHHKSHWSNRWSLLCSFQCLAQDSKDLEPELKEISSLSTLESTDLASLSIKSRHSPDVISAEGFDFLGLAAFHGLSLFVRGSLSSLDSALAPRMVTYLLLCAAAGAHPVHVLPQTGRIFWPHPERRRACFSLAETLLGLGADPNALFPCMTVADFRLIRPSIWVAFTFVTSVFLAMLSYRTEDEIEEELRIGREYVEILRKSGVEFNAICRLWIAHTDDDTGYRHQFDIALSSSSLIRIFKPIYPQLASLHDIYQDKDIVYYRRCLKLRMSKARAPELKEPAYELRISEDESEVFFAIVERIFAKNPTGFLTWGYNPDLINFAQELSKKHGLI
ncbi:hypothetical protein ACLMJK_003981 [Lecanora helva]